ncbi:hypothetical protein [Streptomyces sp. KL116D]|uniref:hypothetical protein n=1 Tax=Streptomyces sp. KL116D TaxID=3045152 RepID=UPI003556778E
MAAANAAMFVCGMGSFAMWFFMTLYAQNVLGYTPIEARPGLVPSSLAVVAAGSKLAPRLMLALRGTERGGGRCPRDRGRVRLAVD